MKKLALICGMALTLGLTACDDFELPNPPGQENPQPEIFEAAGLKLQQASGESTENAVNLTTLSEQGGNVSLAKVTELTDFPSNFDLTFKVEISAQPDFSNSKVIDAEVTDDVVSVTPGVLQGAIRDVITKKPGMLDVYARFAGYAVRGTSVMRLGGEDTYYADYKYSVVPMQPYTIEEAYYLVGSFCDWDLNRAIKFNRSSDLNVYDDPTFSLKIEVDEAQATAGFDWKVVPQSTVTSGNYENGAYGATYNEGSTQNGYLTESPTGDDTNAGVIATAGPYLVTINLEDKTFAVTYAMEFLYCPGTASSFGFKKAQMLSTSDYITYSGAAHLNKQWFMTAQPSTNGLTFYQDEEIVEIDKTGTIYSGGLMVPGEEDKPVQMKVNDNGLYWVEANVVKMTYKASLMTTLSLIGDFNDWKADVDLTPSKDFLTWTATDVELTDGKLKIRANHDRTLDFGGVLNNLTFKGADIPVTAGKYDVTVSFAEIPYVMTLTTK